MTDHVTAAAPALQFPRLLRALPNYRWWRPLLALGLTALFWIVFQVVFGIAVFVLAILVGDVTFPTVLSVEALTKVVIAFFSLDTADAFSLVAGLGGVATLLPAVLLSYRIVGLRPISVLRSVVFRIRWRWLLLSLVPALLITGVSTVGSILVLPALGVGSPVLAPSVPLSTWLVCALIIVILTPIQAAAEEFAFRGLLVQMVGGWVRPTFVAIVVSTAVFAALHTQYELWATLDVTFFGLVAALLTVRTGGLESSIALHTVNNTVAFLFLASGSGGSTTAIDPEHPAQGDPISLLVTLVTMGAYAAIILVLAHRRGVQRELPAAVAGNS
ncbi:MAG: CPBP family intramembrane metalloprotease [Actinomycetota bacterium]|nr:CPBP family intramembrane metalloprotease [Actinomycetota bacterium]